MSSYAKIEHGNDVIPIAENVKGFIIIEKPWFTVIDYVIVHEDSFTGERAAILRECRGIKFDNVTGKIMSRPFEKFFNVGEKPSTSLEAIGDVVPVEVTLKLDGSMVHGALEPTGNVILMTRKGRTKEAIAAEALLSNADRDFIKREVKAGYTPIFEYTSPDNRIVVSYDEPRVTLLAVRHNVTGAYKPNPRTLAMEAGLEPNVSLYEGLTIKELLYEVRAWGEDEGIVAVLPDLTRVKIKADAYVLKHRAKDQLSREKDVLSLVIQGKEDDLLPLLDDDDKEALRRYAGDVRRAFADSIEHVERFVANAKSDGTNAKEFATEYVFKKLDKPFHATAFKVFRGAAETKEFMLDVILRSTQSRGDIEDVKPLVGNVSWDSYRL